MKYFMPNFYLKKLYWIGKKLPNVITKYFTLNFYFKKVTSCSEKITRKTKHFTINFFFFFQKYFTQNIKIFTQN